MKFGSPEFLVWLWLLLPLIAAVMILHRQRAARLAQLISATVWKTVLPGYNPKRNQRRTLLRILALFCIGIAVARPQWGFKWEEVQQRGLDIAVVLDTSKSMLATDIKPNRLQQAQWAVRDFVRHLKGDRIGLVAFAGSSFLQCPVTIDYAAFTMMLTDLYAGIIPRGGTAIAQALETAADSFDTNSEADRVIILITDGEDHVGDPIAMAEKLKKQNIRLYSIGVGTPDGELIPAAGGGYVKDDQGRVVKSTINETLLEKLASSTGGFYVRSAPGDFGLDRIYKLGIANLQRDEQETRLAKVYEERFGWFAAAALLLLLAEGLLRGPKAILLSLLFAMPNLSQASPDAVSPNIGKFNAAYELYRSDDFQGSEKLFADVAAQTEDKELKQKALYNRGTTLYRIARTAIRTPAAVTNDAFIIAAESANLFEQALDLKPDDLAAKQNLERALYLIVDGRLTHAERLVGETEQLLQQGKAKAAKENCTNANKLLDPILEDFETGNTKATALKQKADQVLTLLKKAVDLTKKEMKTVKHVIDMYEYKAAADVMVDNKPERVWAFDIDEKLAQEFQQLIQNNQKIIEIIYPTPAVKP